MTGALVFGAVIVVAFMGLIAMLWAEANYYEKHPEKDPPETSMWP